MATTVYPEVSSFLEFTKAMEIIEQQKRTSYATDADPIINYRKAAELIGVLPEEVMLSRVQEKVLRIANTLGHKSSEIDLDDAIDIAILVAKIYLTSKDRDPQTLDTQAVSDRRDFTGGVTVQ